MTYIYLHGFASSPRSTKARFFASKFAEAGIPLHVPDLAPDFEKLTITGQMEIVRGLMPPDGDVVLLGSSMGGYVASLTALNDDRVKALVLLAPAFGFCQRWESSLGGERSAQWKSTGTLEVFHYGDNSLRTLGYQLVTDASQYPDYPEVRQPALILHGRNDTVVPLANAAEFASRASNRTLVEYDSGHELGNVLEEMWMETENFLNRTVPSGIYQKS